MGETCEVCGRKAAKGAMGCGVPGTPMSAVCFRAVIGSDVSCYCLGYQRSQEALAAARRECEGLRAALNEIIGATDDDIAEKIARTAVDASQ